VSGKYKTLACISFKVFKPTQPLKQIEKLAFQGQVAARMGIISVLYLQNALASLSSSIKSDNTNPDILQSVRLSKKLLLFVPVLYCLWTMKSPNHRF
jgi:hypothetical protein